MRVRLPFVGNCRADMGLIPIDMNGPGSELAVTLAVTPFAVGEVEVDEGGEGESREPSKSGVSEGNATVCVSAAVPARTEVKGGRHDETRHNACFRCCCCCLSRRFMATTATTPVNAATQTPTPRPAPSAVGTGGATAACAPTRPGVGLPLIMLEAVRLARVPVTVLEMAIICDAVDESEVVDEVDEVGREDSEVVDDWDGSTESEGVKEGGGADGRATEGTTEDAEV